MKLPASINELIRWINDEEVCKRIFAQYRWEGNVRCPHCNHDKVYITKAAYKCASAKCYKKFSAIFGTSIENTNLPVKTWFRIIVKFIHFRYTITTDQIEYTGIKNYKTSFYIQKRLNQVKPYLNGNETDIDAFKAIINALCNIPYEKCSEEGFMASKWNVLAEINDFTNVYQYKVLVRYVNHRIKYSSWIWEKDFATAEDILSELFLWFDKNKITNYDSHFLVKQIWLTISRIWKEYWQNTPKIKNVTEKHLKKYRLSFRKEGREKLAPWYVRHLLERKHPTKEITKEMMSKKREELFLIRSGEGSKNTGKGKTFTTYEDEYLRREYSYKSQSQLAKELNRSIKSVEKRLSRLGIKKPLVLN